MLRHAFVFVLALGMLFGGIVVPAGAATRTKVNTAKTNTTAAARQAAVAAARKRHRHHRHHAATAPPATVRATT